MKLWLPSWLEAAARDIRVNLPALLLAIRDPRTPVSAKLLALVVTAYAFSPIDLIPDFIPVIGLIDDLILVPMGIFLAIRLIPKPLMEEFRAAASSPGKRPVSWAGALVIVLIWIAIIITAGWYAMRWIYGP